MDITDIIIIVLVLILVYRFGQKSVEQATCKNIKSMENLENISANNENSIDIDPEKKTKSITKQVDLLKDGAFSDVKMYYSEPVWGEMTGLQKCMNECRGTCTEFGLSGSAMCFPRT
jgi:hypothetical protein